jgi:hypothetical protein
MAVKSTSKKPSKSPSAKSAAKNNVPKASPVTPIEHAAQNNQASNGAPKVPEHKIQEQIRVRAYELFEQRGRHEGYEHEDWVRAEAEIRLKFQREKSA